MVRVRRYHPKFSQDLQACVGYDDSISIALGNRFRQGVRSKRTDVVERPESFGSVRGDIRAARRSRFPSVLLFEISGASVWILRIVHAASDRANWFGDETGGA